MPGCIVSATTANLNSVEKRRRRATPVITSTFENVSDIGVCLGLSLGPPAKAGVRSKRGAVQPLLSGYPLLGTNAISGTYIKVLRSGWRRSGQNIFIAITAGRDALALPRLLYNAQALQSRIYDQQ